MAVLEQPWHLEGLHPFSKNTYMNHHTDSPDLPFEDEHRVRRASSDITTDVGSELVAISPLLSLVPVDEAADPSRWPHVAKAMLELEETPLLLSPDAASRYLPDFLTDDIMEDETQCIIDKFDKFQVPQFPAMTPSPMLQAAANADTARQHEEFFGSEACEWEGYPGWEESAGDIWGIHANMSYHPNAYWDSTEGYASYEGMWEHSGESGWTNHGSSEAWRNPSSAECGEQKKHEAAEQMQKHESRMMKQVEAATETAAPVTETSNEMSSETTVMLRNIPNKFMPDGLARQLNRDYKGNFDFMYLPIDFKNKCNVGYGFINFRSAELCRRFVQDFHGTEVRKCLPGFNSRKVVEVTPARVQGLQENIKRLRNSPVMNQLKDNPEWMPQLFDEYGDYAPFPEPDQQQLPPVRSSRYRPKDAQK